MGLPHALPLQQQRCPASALDIQSPSGNAWHRHSAAMLNTAQQQNRDETSGSSDDTTSPAGAQCQWKQMLPPQEVQQRLLCQPRRPSPPQALPQ